MRSSFLYGSWASFLSSCLALHHLCILWGTVQRPRCLSNLLHVNFFVSISDTPVDSITLSFFFFFPTLLPICDFTEFHVHCWPSDKQHAGVLTLFLQSRSFLILIHAQSKERTGGQKLAS